MSAGHVMQIIGGVLLIGSLAVLFIALLGRMNDRRAVDRDEADQWNYGP